jgi:hypothetical protein
MIMPLETRGGNMCEFIIATPAGASNREIAFRILRWLLPEIDEEAVRDMLEQAIFLLASDD